MRHEVRLVDQHKVPRSEPRGVAPDALHAGEDDRRIPFAPADTGAVDSDWGVRPQREQVLDILLDELERMGDNQHPQSRIMLRDIADQVSNDHALAGRGRHRHERIAATVATSNFPARRALPAGMDEARTWPISGRRLAQRAPTKFLPVINVVRAMERGRRVPTWVFCCRCRNLSRWLPAWPAVPVPPASPPAAGCARSGSCPGKRLACLARCRAECAPA